MSTLITPFATGAALNPEQGGLGLDASEAAAGLVPTTDGDGNFTLSPSGEGTTLVAGTGIALDTSTPGQTVINATGSGVASVIGSTTINVDATDPVNPVVSFLGLPNQNISEASTAILSNDVTVVTSLPADFAACYATGSVTLYCDASAQITAVEAAVTLIPGNHNAADSISLPLTFALGGMITLPLPLVRLDTLTPGVTTIYITCSAAFAAGAVLVDATLNIFPIID